MNCLQTCVLASSMDWAQGRERHLLQVSCLDITSHLSPWNSLAQCSFCFVLLRKTDQKFKSSFKGFSSYWLAKGAKCSLTALICWLFWNECWIYSMGVNEWQRESEAQNILYLMELDNKNEKDFKFCERMHHGNWYFDMRTECMLHKGSCLAACKGTNSTRSLAFPLCPENTHRLGNNQCLSGT